VTVLDYNKERNCEKKLAYAIHVIECQVSFHTVYDIQIHR